MIFCGHGDLDKSGGLVAGDVFQTFVLSNA
jgi:hypothetical protein